MTITPISEMDLHAQDGAICGDYLFRFNAKGLCHVYDARGLASGAESLRRIAECRIDPADPLVPHFNAVCFGAEYFADVNHMLHNLLTVVVGLEFVRMLIDTTPANILEVLTVAITRQIILSHDNPWSTVASVACIAGLFAIRRFLIRRSELQEEMVEID